MVYHERLHELASTAMARRNDTLKQLTLYRECLALQLRIISGKIVDKILEDRLNEPNPNEIPLIPSTK